MPTCSNCGRQVEAEANFCSECGQNQRVSVYHPKLEDVKVLWEEYKYRHDKIWKLIFQITTAAVALSAIPYLNTGVVKGLTWWVLLVPILALALVLFATRVMDNELRLFFTVRDRYWVLQREVFKISYEEKSRFDRNVKLYLDILFTLGVVNFVIIAKLWVPHVTKYEIPQAAFVALMVVATIVVLVFLFVHFKTSDNASKTTTETVSPQPQPHPEPKQRERR